MTDSTNRSEGNTGPGKLHVLIVGAGVTGLLVAQGLKQAGIPFTVFESEVTGTRQRTREWGMTIHWSRPLLAQVLPANLLAKLSVAQVDPSFDSTAAGGYSVPFYNGKTGDHIMNIPMPNAVRVSRRRMRALCAEGIDIVYGKKLVGVSSPSNSGVTVAFEDGSTYDGSIVIGTDGAQSAVRQQLLGPEAGASTPLGVILYSLNVCYGDAEKALTIRKLHPMNHVALHPDKALTLWTSIQEVPDPEHPEDWQFQLMPTWIDEKKTYSSGAAGLAALKEIAETMAEPWKSSILWIPDDTEIAVNSVSYWVTTPWDNRQGTVTLAGDAAHPLPPHRGQGLNNCIADVAKFVEAIVSVRDGTATQAEAISAYDEELVKRGGAEVELSRKNALLVHDFEKFMDSPVLKQGYAKNKTS